MLGALNMKSKEMILKSPDNEWLKALEDPEYMKDWPLAVKQKEPKKNLVISEQQRRGLNNG